MDPYIAIIGANGVGKSTILEALRFMLDPEFRIHEDDWNVCSKGEPLRVRIHCTRLNALEYESWGRYLQPDGSVSISKIATRDDAGVISVAYRGTAQRHRPFDALYEGWNGNKTAFRAAFNQFRGEHHEYEFRNVTRADEALEQLVAWEAANPGRCERLEVQYDAKDVEGRLYEAFRVVHVRAVSPVEDALHGKGSVLSDLINQMLWPQVLAKPAFLELQQHVAHVYREIFPEEGETELDVAGELINASLGQFAPGTTVQLAWNGANVLRLDPPKYDALVTEDGVSGDIARKGSGVQRALVVAVLNALNENTNAQHAVAGDVNLGPTTLLLVEEPELYQHPTRARHFAKSLRGLARVDEGAPRMQVVVTTHSPYFVSVTNFEAVRLLRRETDGRESPRRRIAQATLDDIWTALRTSRHYPEASDESLTARARLSGALDYEVREGFFATAIVLTEGSSDVPAIVGGLARLGIDPDAKGIAVLGAGGIGELDKMFLIFRAFGIPTFLVWDGDATKGRHEPTNRKTIAERNRRLLALLEGPLTEYPATLVAPAYAVFHDDRETTLRGEFGDQYDRVMEAVCARHGYERVRGEKVASVVMEAYEELYAAGKASTTLDAICAAVAALVP